MKLTILEGKYFLFEANQEQIDTMLADAIIGCVTETSIGRAEETEHEALAERASDYMRLREHIAHSGEYESLAQKARMMNLTIEGNTGPSLDATGMKLHEYGEES